MWSLLKKRDVFVIAEKDVHASEKKEEIGHVSYRIEALGSSIAERGGIYLPGPR